MAQLVGCALLPHPPIMLSEIGGTESEKVKESVRAVEQASQQLLAKNPSTIVIITPHGPVFQDAVGINSSPVLRGSLASFGAAEVGVSFETNNLLVQNIIKQSERLGIGLIVLNEQLSQQYRFSLQLDHGTVIPLYYLQKAGFKGQIVQLTAGCLTYPEMYAFGKAVQAGIEMARQKVAVVASGDLSHRLFPGAPAGYSANGRKFDEKIMELMQGMDVKGMFSLDPVLVQEAGECGLRPILFLMGVLDGLEAGSEILSYEGPFGVGYGVVIFSPKCRRKAKEGRS